MTMMLAALMHPLALSAQIKAEILPIALFFGMFFAVFGLGGIVIRHMPRKSGSMLDEILNEKWDDGGDETDGERSEAADTSVDTAAEPMETQDEHNPNAADEKYRK